MCGAAPNVSGECGFLANGRGAVAIARFEQEAGASYRVIGRDGVERNVVGIPDWIAAIRSAAIDLGKANVGGSPQTIHHSALLLAGYPSGHT